MRRGREKREGDRTLGTGGGVRVQWLGTSWRQEKGTGGKTRLSPAPCRAALSISPAHSRGRGSDMGVSGSSSHQVLRCFTPGNYQPLLQC